MPTLVLSPTPDYDSLALRVAATAAGWAVDRIGPVVPDRLRTTPDVVFHAEPNFGRAVADRLGWDLADPADDWLLRLEPHHRLRTVRLMTLARARREPGPAFVKLADYRARGLRSMTYADPDAAGRENSVHDDEAVLVAEPVTWDVEFRCFVVGREVATLSASRRNGQSNRSDKGRWPVKIDELLGGLSFARRLLADPAVELPPAVVIDIGHIAGRGWAVVEANPAWCSALYGCEASRVLPVLRRACRKKDCVQ
jgi:hypothetical protein